ncbi:hypothetical protein G4228_006863 [Cervus hanglu yarkandensis]|nr:hypothetical protein G4228_006863 [Cervus hanglu yarkandensis]
MYAKGGKGSAVPSDSQAREKLALYVYEYLLHVGAQKSAQTFLSEIRWEKNITLGEPPGFLHSWWCVFWDLYCAAPDRREACEHSSEAKAFQDYSAAAAPSPVMGSMAPNDAMASGPMAPGFFQIPYSSSSPGSYSGPPGGGGPPGTPIMPSPGDSTNSSENMYTIMNPIGPGAGRSNFPLGPGPEGPMAAMSAMEPHHVNGSLETRRGRAAGVRADRGRPQSSPGAVAGLSNTPGTPRDDGEMAAAGTFLHPFPSESVSDCVDSPPRGGVGPEGPGGQTPAGRPGGQSKTVTAAGQVGGRPRHPSLPPPFPSPRPAPSHHPVHIPPPALGPAASPRTAT